MDGIYPYIFNERSKHNTGKILYISLTYFKNTHTMFSVKNEINVTGRILEGALDAHKLLCLKQTAHFCSFVHEWTIKDFLILRIKYFLLNMFISAFFMIKNSSTLFYNKIFNYIQYFSKNNKECKIYIDWLNECIAPIRTMITCKNITHDIYTDFLLYYCI